MTPTQKTTRRPFEGVVVSRTNKSLVVAVERVLVHPKYGKRYTRTRTFHVHDEKDTTQVGQKVAFIECRPISRTKRWRLVEKA